MFNVVFCHPGTQLIDMIGAKLDLCSSEPVRLMRARFRRNRGEGGRRDWSKPHKPFTVNIDAVLEREKAR